VLLSLTHCPITMIQVAGEKHSAVEREESRGAPPPGNRVTSDMPGRKHRYEAEGDGAAVWARGVRQESLPRWPVAMRILFQTQRQCEEGLCMATRSSRFGIILNAQGPTGGLDGGRSGGGKCLIANAWPGA
jgi:hypothetical protein